MKVANGFEELKKETVEFCRHIAGQSEVTAVALLDAFSENASKERNVYEIIAIINGFQPRLMNYLKTFNSQTIVVFAVDQWIFEQDINRGFLGEAVAGRLIFPYSAFFGGGYLKTQEASLKKRLVLEVLENLVFSFPELANRLFIKPQYFLYEAFSSRIRVFPLLAYNLSDLSSCFVENEPDAMQTYNMVLKELVAEGKINASEGYITISKEFIAQCRDPRIRIINLARNAPRTLFNAIFGVVPQLLNVVSQNTEAFLKTQKINWMKQPYSCEFVDPQKFVFVKTAEGEVSLADRVDIKGYARKILKKDAEAEIEVEPVGGVLNDVYLIRTHGNSGERKVLAKRFKEWSGFKWFPLTLWSFGARSFAVSGQARLSKECAISEQLIAAGFAVPKILYVSNVERLVFMEFIDGENLSLAIKRIATANDDESIDADLEIIRRVGAIQAGVHAQNISLGDTKPDNVLIKPDGTIYLIDFEQAMQSGDSAWDIAVFLYYCGHYLQPFYSNSKAEAIAKAFIDGYLQGGGDVEEIRKAGLTKYTRVFSIFTMPAIMLAISNVCRKAQATKK
ncbi:MAG: phosphotransferase [Candidatus Bathyarchaeota archaeon]|nr:phosphotransferase [Candidatus Bathyarchaeota archaeon]